MVTSVLMKFLIALKNQVVQSAACGGEVWGLKARWHHANGELTMCTEAALKQVRAFQVLQKYSHSRALELTIVGVLTHDIGC